MSVMFSPGGAADLNFVMDLVKVDAEKRLIYARAAQEIPDKAKEIMDYETAKPAFQQWSDYYSGATNGLSKGNLRVMHTKTVAGRLEELKFNDADKAIDAVLHVQDDNEWRKCLDGNYTGVSVGGGYLKKWVEPGTGLTRYTPIVRELSLVDNPCIPTARFAELVKADGMVGQIELRGNVRTFADVWGARPQTFAEQWAARPVAPMTFGELQKDAAAAAALAASQRGGWLPTFSTYSTGQSKPKKPRNTSRITMRNAYVASRPLGLSGKYNRALPATPKQPATLGKAYTAPITFGERMEKVLGMAEAMPPEDPPTGKTPVGFRPPPFFPSLAKPESPAQKKKRIRSQIGMRNAFVSSGGAYGTGGQYAKPLPLGKAYTESKHKRAKDGKFSSTGIGARIGMAVGGLSALGAHLTVARVVGKNRLARHLADHDYNKKTLKEKFHFLNESGHIFDDYRNPRFGRFGRASQWSLPILIGGVAAGGAIGGYIGSQFEPKKRHASALRASAKQPATLGKAYTESKHKRAKNGEFSSTEIGARVGVAVGGSAGLAAHRAFTRVGKNRLARHLAEHGVVRTKVDVEDHGVAGPRNAPQLSGPKNKWYTNFFGSPSGKGKRSVKATIVGPDFHNKTTQEKLNFLHETKPIFRDSLNPSLGRFGRASQWVLPIGLAGIAAGGAIGGYIGSQFEPKKRHASTLRASARKHAAA